MSLDGSCAYALYSSKNATTVMPLRNAILRTLIGDWVDPFPTVFCQISGPTSHTYIRALKGVLGRILDDTQPLHSLGLLDKNGYDPLTEGQKLLAILVIERVTKGLNRRAVFRTNKRWIGTDPYSLETGDCVVAFVGGDVSFVLRPRGDYFLLVGERYVEGIIFGELFENPWFRRNGNMNEPLVYPFDIHQISGTTTTESCLTVRINISVGLSH